MSARTQLAQAYFALATMLDAGIPILRSLDIIIEGRQGYLKQIFTKIRDSVSQGCGLAEALAEHRRVFPDLDRMLIEAAETSGSLTASFTMLSQWHDFVHRITRRLQMGLIYPVLILHIAAFVFPLPAFILGKQSFAEFLMAALGILLLLYIPLGIVIGIMSLRDRAPLLRLPLDFLVLRIPVLGLAIYHMSICRYAKAFAMLYGAGVPIVETAERATRATGNMIVARQFAGGKASVRAGGMAWEGFSERLPTEYRQLWQIGEETGELDRIATKVAEISGDRADLLFTEFSKWLPRICYFIIIGIMAFMILTLAHQVRNNMMVEAF